MATATAPTADRPGSASGEGTRRLPSALVRVPTWAWVSGGLIALMALSAFLRSRYLGGEFWMDEGITTGISLHPLSQIPGVLRYDGNPPLYYMALHVWMSMFGSSESATHSLSLIFGLLTIPAGAWAAGVLFGRRAGIMAALLFAFNAWLTAYAQETRMYELMGLLGVVADRRLRARVHRAPPPLSVPVRRRTDVDALHPFVGHILLRRLGDLARPGPDRLRGSPGRVQGCGD